MVVVTGLLTASNLVGLVFLLLIAAVTLIIANGDASVEFQMQYLFKQINVLEVKMLVYGQRTRQFWYE